MNRRIAGLGRLLPIIVLGLPLMAQGTQTASITGEVVDKSGTPIAGARVKLTSPSLQGAREFITDGAGRFAARLLPPGEYRIVVAKEGLEVRVLNQRVGLEQSFSPKITLSPVAGVVVEVVAANVAVDKTETKSAQNYTKEQIDTLPVGRTNLLDIVYLAPGVVANASESRGGVSIRGSMGTGNLFLVDGQNINDNLYQGQRLGIIFDSISETQVLTGALPAEYGDVEGGVVNSVTRSGGDDFSGSIRWDLSNPAWNAVKPKDSRASYGNNVGNQRSFQMDGPIIKSKLWFHVGYFDDHPNEVKSLGPNTFFNETTSTYYNPAATSYQGKTDDYRREIKLTWAVNENHTLSAAYHNYKNTAVQDYGAGDLVTLTNLTKESSFWNVAFRSVWTPSLTSSIRYGEKKFTFGSVTTPGANTTDWILYSGDDGLSYRNNLFNPADPQPDQRDNRTFNLKFTYFLTAAGNHQFDAGLDWYEGTTKASGDQGPVSIVGPAGSPTAGKRLNQWWVDIADYDPVAGTAAVYDGYFGEYIPDKLTAATTGLYLNDKWEVNNQLVFQLGVRMDSYSAKGQFNGKVQSGNAFSPRLGVKYDIFGDSAWVAGLSFARYNGRMLETILQNRTYVNNSRYYAFAWTGPARATYAQIQDVNNYDFTSAGIVDYSDAALNIVIPKNLKPQTVDELQASLAHTFHSGMFGNGYAKLTLVSKKWGNLIDYRAGNDGQVTDAFGNAYYLKTYYNNSAANRKYEAMELELNTTKGEWSLGGYISWSKLRGNFVGEGAASPGRGQGLSSYTVQDGVQMYDPAILNPNGYLPGHVPLRMRWTAVYSSSNSLGKVNYGFVYRFDSGLHYSDSRTIRRAAINPGLSGQFGSSATQYMGEQGNHVFPATSFLDFGFQQDFEIAKIANKSVSGFAKFDIGNVLNHQQVASFNTTYASVGSSGSYTDPWVKGSSFGQPTGANNYGAARTVKVSFGVKF